MAEAKKKEKDPGKEVESREKWGQRKRRGSSGPHLADSVSVEVSEGKS